MAKSVSVLIVLVLVELSNVCRCSPDVLMATCHYRINYLLDIPAWRTVRDLTIAQCLMICQNTDECQSFNYGNGTCFILDDFLCTKAENYTLTSAYGMRYCDLLKSPEEVEEVTLSSPACTNKGRCDRRCGCVTKDTKESCVFPFILTTTQKVYHDCTTDSSSMIMSSEDVSWCSTKVNEYGYHVNGHVGVCADWC